MAEKSAIEWTDSTWNPVTGCTKLSAGCDHCYAERFSERFRGVVGHPFETGFDLTLRPERIQQPKGWRRPRLIFVNSMSDLFHKSIPTEYIRGVFDTMETADWHIYQVLTKRSSLMRNFVNQRYPKNPVPPHIWLGTSVENASTIGRLRHLKQTNASVRFVSFEPLLASIGVVDLGQIHWVIAGGESGPGARDVDVEWLRELRDQCQIQRVPFFFKQWGGRNPKSRGNTLDGRQWLEYPAVSATGHSPGTLRVAGAPTNDDLSAKTMEVGPWAREKLNCLRKYLHAYTTILRKQRFKGYFYIDAFAGSGSLKVREQQADDLAQRSLLEVSKEVSQDAAEVYYISGSPRVALEIEHPFTDYIFIEVDKDRIEHLRNLKQEFSGPRIHIKERDCNEYLRNLLKRNRNRWRHWRGVVFLDPFGMHVPWNTIADLGKTRSIEVFINFPVGMAIQRLLKRSGEFSARERAKLNRYFGTNEWFNLLYGTETDLLGDKVSKSRNAGEILVKWYRKRLKEVFGYVTTAREIQSTNGRPLYYLIFCRPEREGSSNR